ncbi:MAG: alpha/beta fold hydrolase, partial [Dehalococcoidia bacterium]
MGMSQRRHALTALAFAVLLGAVATLGSQRVSAGKAITMQSDFAGLVDIGGGRRLYLECHGQGSPTVLLEAGSAARADYWSRDRTDPASSRQMVMPAIAGFTRVCAYDRPGTIFDFEDPELDPLGLDYHPSRSDPLFEVRGGSEVIADFRALLQAAAIPAPYVLVGHSMGGALMRLYASAYPEEVAGMVLVDSTTEDVWVKFEEAMTPAQWQAFEGPQFSLEPSDEYPAFERLDARAIVAQVREAQRVAPLRPMPLAVLAHGIPFAAPTPDWPTEVTEAIMLEEQQRLATLVPDARFTIAARSGHNIHQDQPELVTEAIRQVVEGVRNPDTWYDLDSCCAGSSATTKPGPTAGSSGLKQIDAAALQATVDAAVQEMLVPGAMVLLRTPQGEFTISSGTTELGATIPPSVDTYFRIASNTKTMTAAVIMQLAQEGKLDLSDPVSMYVSNVPNGDIITIAELLEMRSGLYNYTNAPEFAAALDRDPTKAWTRAEVLAIAFARPPNFPPGTAFEYCNTNYELLGQIAEQVDGRPLARAMQARLFGPLGLQRTLLPARTEYTLPAPYTHGYLYGSTSVALAGEPPYSPEVRAAARAGTLLPTDYTNLNHSWAEATGGVVSTAGDLATWIESLVRGRVLDAASQRRWLDSLQPGDPGQQYGYGIADVRWAANTIYFHGGETAGYNSFMGHDPTNQVTLVVWTNLTVSLDMAPTANALM